MYRALWTAVDSGIILFHVFLAPLIIFEGILDHGDPDNGQQGQESENPVVLVSKRREKLHYHDDQEVGVGHFRKLFEQIVRDESQARVLGGGHDIKAELLFIRPGRCVDAEMALLRSLLLRFGELLVFWRAIWLDLELLSTFI